MSAAPSAGLGPAIVAPVTLGGATAALATVSSAGINATAGYRLFASVAARNSVGDLPDEIVVSDDLSGGTWQQVFDTKYVTATNPRLRGALWYLDVPGGGLTGAIVTASCTSTTNICLGLFEMQYAPGPFDNVKSEDNDAGDPSPTLNSLRISSAVLGQMVDYGGSTIVAPDGFTQINQQNQGAGGLRLQTIYALAPAPITAVWTTSASRSMGSLVEVRR